VPTEHRLRARSVSADHRRDRNQDETSDSARQLREQQAAQYLNRLLAKIVPLALGQPAKARQRVAIGGAIAIAIPAAPGLALAATGSPHAVPLLISSGVIAVISVTASTLVKIHGNRQQTRRLEIRQEPVAALAKAIARCLDDAHAAASDVPYHQRVDEAASVRATAMKAVEQTMPAVLAMIEQNSLSEEENKEEQT
jgi:hypothetical protein